MAFHQETTIALAELVAEDPPAPLVDAEIERRIRELAADLQGRGANIEQFLTATGQTGPELVDRLREAAIPAVKGDMALRAVADAEGVEVDDEDVDQEIARIAAEMNQEAALVRATLDQEDGLRGVRAGTPQGESPRLAARARRDRRRRRRASRSCPPPEPRHDDDDMTTTRPKTRTGGVGKRDDRDTGADEQVVWHRNFAIEAFNRSWDLLEQADRDEAADAELLAVAFASRWHWGQVGGPEQRR